MTAVGRPDNGQDEGREHRPYWTPLAWGGITAGCHDCPWVCAGATDAVHVSMAKHVTSARPGAGEQQREQILAVLRPVLMERVAQERTDALLALLAHTDEETR